VGTSVPLPAGRDPERRQLPPPRLRTRRPPKRARPLRFHDLRHTYATLMIAAGAHAKYLQAQMGHASIRVTLDLYGHLYPDANRTVLRELDRLIEPPGLGL